MRGLIKVFFLQGKWPKELYTIMKEMLGDHAPSYDGRQIDVVQ